MRPSRSMQRIDLCGQPFKGLRERDMYYVDKSLLIKELLDSNDRGVFLFTRPRRFGKTTNLSMLDAFFNIQYAGNPWFDDLEISRSRDTPSIQVTRTDSRSSISISTIRKRTPTNHTSTSSVSQLRTPTSRTDTFSKMTISIPRSGTTSIPSPGVTYRRISYPPRSRTSRMQYPGTTEDQSSSSMNTIVQ